MSPNSRAQASTGQIRKIPSPNK